MPKPSVRNSRKPLDSSIDISFYVDGWEMALDEQIATYKFLLELVTHPKVHSIMVSEKLKRPRKKSADPELEERFKELDAALPKELKKEFDKFFPLIVNADRFNVLRVYSQQMIVVAYTLFEGILEDFVTSLFGRYPERMYEYIGVETNLRGKIDLHELLDVGSKSSLIYKLAQKAASNVVRGNLADIIKRLQTLTKNALDGKLFQKMLSVQELRNQIVHEMSSVDDLPVKPNEADFAISLTRQILLHLEDVAKKLDISIRRLEIPEDLK